MADGFEPGEGMADLDAFIREAFQAPEWWSITTPHGTYKIYNPQQEREPMADAEFAPDDRRMYDEYMELMRSAEEKSRESSKFHSLMEILCHEDPWLTQPLYLDPYVAPRDSLRHTLHDNGWNWTGDRDWTW